MLTFPITRLFDRVGTVRAEQDGLYLKYEAMQEAALAPDTGLFYHGPAGTQRLGRFFPEGNALICRGKISLRRLGGSPDAGVFSVTGHPWREFDGTLDGGVRPPAAVYRETENGLFLAFPDTPVFPPELTPFFCFLVPQIIEGLPCLTMTVDRLRRPIMEDITP